jgi:hypothetical protein
MVSVLFFPLFLSQILHIFNVSIPLLVKMRSRIIPFNCTDRCFAGWYGNGCFASGVVLNEVVRFVRILGTIARYLYNSRSVCGSFFKQLAYKLTIINIAVTHFKPLLFLTLPHQHQRVIYATFCAFPYRAVALSTRLLRIFSLQSNLLPRGIPQVFSGSLIRYLTSLNGDSLYCAQEQAHLA